MKIKTRRTNKVFFQFIGMIVFYFIVQLKFLNDMWFSTDELDIMVLGRGLSRGMELYTEMFSQHMPFSYYISALFYLMGANSVLQQRIAFYLFFAIMWTLIVYMYSNHINKTVLVTYPLLHCCLIQTYDMGTQILSEHLAGIGAVILLLEYITFVKTRELKIRNCIMISIAIVLTFGTIFVAVFPVFFIAVGVFGLECKWMYTEKNKLKEWLPYIIKKYVTLIIVVAIPWMILFLYYIYTHTFSEFIYGAYTINREVYPKYNGGLGSNILGTFLQPMQFLFETIVNILNSQTMSYSLWLQLIIVVCVFLYTYKMYEKHGVLVALTVYLFVGSLGVRGFYNFHATHFIEVSSLMIVYVLYMFAYKSKEYFVKLGFLKQIAFISIVVVLASGYFKDITEVSTITFTEPTNDVSEIINTITEDDESIWTIVFCNDIIMMSDRTSVGAAVTTPWTWEGYGKKQFKDLKKNPPKVACYSAGFEVWGYKLDEYAPNVVRYLKKNYKELPNVAGVFVRNDYYEEACTLLEQTKEE